MALLMDLELCLFHMLSVASSFFYMFQVGCKMGCKFCATGSMGFKSNLSSGEIVEQLVHALSFSRIRNVVFMVYTSVSSSYSTYFGWMFIFKCNFILGNFRILVLLLEYGGIAISFLSWNTFQYDFFLERHWCRWDIWNLYVVLL